MVKVIKTKLRRVKTKHGEIWYDQNNNSHWRLEKIDLRRKAKLLRGNQQPQQQQKKN